MRAVVVFESMFGNTREVAEHVAEGIGGEVTVAEVGAADTRFGDDVALVVVGGPTHAFGMSRPSSRESAAQETDDDLVSMGIGIREWLDRLEAAGTTRFATFDTRVDRPRFPGSAASAAARRLRKGGHEVVDEPMSFWVGGMTGPLIHGERARAREWGTKLASLVGSSEHA